jgi:hypothetical protein
VVLSFGRLFVDVISNNCWKFILKKSYLKAIIINLLRDLKITEIRIKFIRCDDDGENRSMKDNPNVKKFGVKFEFSGPRTSQRKFQNFYGRIFLMLNGASLKGELKSKMLVECAMTTTNLSNVIAKKSENKCPYELLFWIQAKD